jgi:hypothetical protein
MRESLLRFLVESLRVAMLLLSANLAAFAEEEKYYRSDTGLELSNWGNGDAAVTLNFEAGEGYVYTDLAVANQGQTAQPETWIFYDKKGEEREAGKRAMAR